MGRTGFLQCLEVEPTIDKYGFGWIYKVTKDDLELIVDVQSLESYVQMKIRHRERKISIVGIYLFVLGKVRYINDKRGEYLEFAKCLIVPPVFTRRGSENVLDNIPPDWAVELRIKRQIQIRYRD